VLNNSYINTLYSHSYILHIYSRYFTPQELTPQEQVEGQITGQQRKATAAAMRIIITITHPYSL
jgi:hypothetical protein